MNENVGTYLIPNNFIDEGRVFNGAIRTRYLIEAVIIFIVIAGPCWLLIPKTVSAKIGITLGCSLPLAMLALVGINGDSLSGFLKSAWSWRKERQIMLYNDHTRTYAARPVDVMMSEVYASDILMNSLDKWRTQRAQRDANIDLVENVDFVFQKDEEYERMTPQDIRERQKREKKEAEKAKKAQKKKQKKVAELPSGTEAEMDTKEVLPVTDEDEDAAMDASLAAAAQGLENIPFVETVDTAEDEVFLFVDDDTDADGLENTIESIDDDQSETFSFFEETPEEDIEPVDTEEDFFSFEETDSVDSVEIADVSLPQATKQNSQNSRKKRSKSRSRKSRKGA